MLSKDGELIRKVGEKKGSKYTQEELNHADLTRPMTFRILDKMTRLDRHSGKKRGPRRIMIETSYVVDEPGQGVSEYRFYESERRKSKGNDSWLEYAPDFVEIVDGKIVVDPQKKLDLALFLLKHPKRVGGKNRSTDVRPIFYLDDPIQKNRDKARERTEMAKVHKFIYDEESKLKDDDLRNIASAFMITDAQAITIEEVQNALYDVAKKNPQKFLSYRAPNKDVQMRTLIGKAIDKNYLRHDPGSQRWEVSNDGQEFKELIKTAKTDSPIDRLVDWFKRFDEENRQYDALTELIGEEVGEPVE